MSTKALACLVLLIAISGCAPAQKPAPPAPPPATVTVVKPVTRGVTEQLEFTGRTAAVETVEVRARVGGYLKNITFHEGAEVHKGDPLLLIDPEPYRAALHQAEGTRASAEAKVKTQDLDVARYRNLFQNGGLVSRQLLDQTIGARAETQANRAALDAAVERAKLDLDYTRVAAPIGGVVSRALVTPGNVVVANQTVLTTIVSVDPIYAYFDVDEATVLRARRMIREKRMTSYRDARLPVRLALSGEEGFPHEGTINFVENVLEPSTGTLNVRGVFPNRDRALSPGLFARVRFALGGPRNAILVPQQALSMDQRGEYLKLVKADGTVEERTITTGRSEGTMVVVEKGLTGDERVVVTGLQKARAGAKVAARLQEPALVAGAIANTEGAR